MYYIDPPLQRNRDENHLYIDIFNRNTYRTLQHSMIDLILI